MGVEAARSLIEGIIEPAKIVGATNLLSVMFSSVSTKICELIIQREFVKSKNELWNQCLVDALRISHPLIVFE